MAAKIQPLDRFRAAAKKAIILDEFENGKNEKPISSTANIVCYQVLKSQIDKNVKSSPKNRYLARIGKTCLPLKIIYRKFGLKHIALVFALIGYSFLGGWIFSLLEYDNEVGQKLAKNKSAYHEAFDISNRIIEIVNKNFTIDTDHVRKQVYNIFADYQVQKNLYADDKFVWDFWGGMFFASTVYTTIGYGHYAPVTDYGRISVMIYALFGIPLVLALLADWGKILTPIFNQFWTKWRQIIAYLMTKINRSEKYSLALRVARNSEFDFPIPLALFFIFLWILICSYIFCLWETEWRYFDAFYFFVISLSTIGLGDITPTHQKYMMCNFPLVIIGLALVALVVNLIQNKIEKINSRATELIEYQLGLAAFEESKSEPDLSVQNNNRLIIDQDRTTLGIIQTMKQKVISKRRKIGVQTDESFLSPNWNRNPESTDINSDSETKLLIENRAG